MQQNQKITIQKIKSPTFKAMYNSNFYNLRDLAKMFNISYDNLYYALKKSKKSEHLNQFLNQ